MQNVLSILLLTLSISSDSELLNSLICYNKIIQRGTLKKWVLGFQHPIWETLIRALQCIYYLHLFQHFRPSAKFSPRKSTFLAISEFVFPVVFFVWHWFLRLSDHYFLLLTLDRQLFYMTHARTVGTIKVLVNRVVSSKSQSWKTMRLWKICIV